jgi:DNA-binding transcriptional regulator YbjK
MTVADTAGLKRARRHDPDRKSRIVDATLQIIAERGVAGTTHRLIAEAADVSLGSLTYHFTGLDDLLEQAFRRHAEHLSVLYEQHFDHVTSRAELVEAITDLIHGNLGTSEGEAIVSYELYLAALRNPALRSLTQSWMATSHRVLQRFVDLTTAQGVDALIEGLIIHITLATDPIKRDQTALYVDRALGTDQLRLPEEDHP